MIGAALRCQRFRGTLGRLCLGSKAPTEAVAIGERIEAIERPKAEARKADAGKANLPTVSAGNFPSLTEPPARVRDAVGRPPRGGVD